VAVASLAELLLGGGEQLGIDDRLVVPDAAGATRLPDRRPDAGRSWLPRRRSAPSTVGAGSHPVALARLDPR
jgi:hypothetical protein